MQHGSHNLCMSSLGLLPEGFSLLTLCMFTLLAVFLQIVPVENFFKQREGGKIMGLTLPFIHCKSKNRLSR